MNRDIRVDNVLYDHARCTAFIVYNEQKIHATLVSTLSCVGGSSKRWIDESSYGMCTYRCTNKEDLTQLAECIKDMDWWWTKKRNSDDIDYEQGNVDTAAREMILSRLTCFEK